MCSNYVSVSSQERLLQFFGVFRDDAKLQPEVWPTGLAPFIRLAQPGSGHRVLEEGHFGLLPHFAKELAFGRRTYNARSETVHQLPSFRDAWRRGQRCVVPVEVLYEPHYGSGRAVRWAIYRPGRVPMGVAGIYTQWTDCETGEARFSFAMLTVNADEHPFYSQFHRPGDEKRMPVILPPGDYDAWLGCTLREAPAFFRMAQEPLEGEAAPLPPRMPVVAKVRPPPPPAPSEPEAPDEPELF